MAKEYLLAFEYYLVFLAFAPIGLIVARPFIQNFRAAYTLSKLLGLLLFGYLIWLLSSLRILDFQSILLIRILFALVVGASMYALWKYWPKDWQNILKNILTVEIFWFVFYFLYLWLRSHNAEIHGTERFMDMAFFKASSMANYFPPIDPWHAGNPINYYYYGHYLFFFFFFFYFYFFFFFSVWLWCCAKTTAARFKKKNKKNNRPAFPFT